MNLLYEVIASLEAETDRSELNDLLLQQLYEKVEEVDEDITDEEAEQLILRTKQDVWEACLAKNLSEEGWDEAMLESMALIRRVLYKLNIGFLEYKYDDTIYAFHSKVDVQGKPIRMYVYLEEDPRSCRIDAVFPFRADPKMVYPLCCQLQKESYSRRYGTLKYDESDNALSFQYSFPIGNGLHEDDFENMYAVVASAAEKSYDVVFRYALGKFKKVERIETICRAQQLLIELSM